MPTWARVVSTRPAPSLIPATVQHGLGDGARLEAGELDAARRGARSLATTRAPSASASRTMTESPSQLVGRRKPRPASTALTCSG